MIYKIKGRLEKKEDKRLIIKVKGFFYEIYVPKTVSRRLRHNEQDEIELIIYHYLNIDKNRAVPVMIGFLEELEKDFFSKFISVSGVGPKAALKAFDRPVAVIAQAIEQGDIEFLKTLAGIGQQRAKQIVAHLQGKVGRFALIKDEQAEQKPIEKEVVEEAKEILKRLQYNYREVEEMIKTALKAKPQIDSTEDLLNEIYHQRK